MRNPKLLGIPVALVLLAGCTLPSRSEEPALRPGPGVEATKIGEVSFDKGGVIELSGPCSIQGGDGTIVYYASEQGVLGAVDKTLKTQVAAKFEDSDKELYDLLAKHSDRPAGEIEFPKVLSGALGMRVANRRVYLLQEYEFPDSKSVRVVQALKDGKVEWTWFVWEKAAGDWHYRQFLDVSGKGSEIALVDMGKGDSFSVFDRKQGRVASFKFAEPKQEEDNTAPGGAGDKPKGAEPAPVKPQPPSTIKDYDDTKFLSPELKELLEEHRRIMAKLEKEKEKEKNKEEKEVPPAPPATKVDWPMNEIHLLRFLPDDTYLVVGTDQDGPTVVWLKKDGTVKAGIKGSQLGHGAIFAGMFGSNPVFLAQHELTMRIVWPDLTADEIPGLKATSQLARVVTLDDDTLVVFRGPGLKWELYSIKKKEKK